MPPPTPHTRAGTPSGIRRNTQPTPTGPRQGTHEQHNDARTDHVLERHPRRRPRQARSAAPRGPLWPFHPSHEESAPAPWHRAGRNARWIRPHVSSTQPARSGRTHDQRIGPRATRRHTHTHSPKQGGTTKILLRTSFRTPGLVSSVIPHQPSSTFNLSGMLQKAPRCDSWLMPRTPRGLVRISSATRAPRCRRMIQSAAYRRRATTQERDASDVRKSCDKLHR